MATEMRKTGGGRLLNNMTTGLTVAPLILMTAERGLARLRRCRAQRYVEFALLAVGLGGTLYLTHTWATVGAGRIPFQLYGPLPFLYGRLSVSALAASVCFCCLLRPTLFQR